MSGWLPEFLLALAPLLLLVGLLVHGRYPGEETIEKFRRALIRVFKFERGHSSLWTSSPAAPRTPGGGRLIACSLAGRGPPLHI